MFALLLATSVGANRIQIHEADQAKFGASCDDLQTTFRSRLATFQGVLDANPDLDAVTRATKARTMMRTYGIIRTLRRARTCAWVVDNDSEEMEGARSIVQSLLSRNACADAARAELAAGASAESGEIDTQSLQRSIAILSSETCEAPAEMPQDAPNLDENMDAQMADAEDDLQDKIEEFEDSAGAAFVQTEDAADRGLVARFFRTIGVAFLMLFLLLACVGSIAIISSFIIQILGLLAYRSGLWGCNAGIRCDMAFSIFAAGIYGGAAAGVVGIGACSYQLYNQFLLPSPSQ